MARGLLAPCLAVSVELGGQDNVEIPGVILIGSTFPAEIHRLFQVCGLHKSAHRFLMNFICIFFSLKQGSKPRLIPQLKELPEFIPSLHGKVFLP